MSARRKLTVEDVIRIRESTRSLADLAADLNVTVSCVSASRTGRTWRFVPGAIPADPYASKNAGQRNGRAKLNVECVREARELHRAGESFEELAARYGVTVGVARNAVTGRSWASVAGAIPGRRNRPPKALASAALDSGLASVEGMGA